MAIEGSGQSTLMALGVGLAIGLGVGIAIIVAAFFQDVLIATARWLFVRGRGILPRRTSAAPAARRAGAFFFAWLAFPARLRARLSAAASGMRAARRRSVRRRPVNDRREAATDDRAVEPSATVVREEVVSVADIAPDVEAPFAVARPPVRRREIGHHRQYTPASRVHVDERVREFLEKRKGHATLDVVVRYLNREFGAGLGMGLLESMHRRGDVVFTRHPQDPTKLVVHLPPDLREPAAEG